MTEEKVAENNVEQQNAPEKGEAEDGSRKEQNWREAIERHAKKADSAVKRAEKAEAALREFQESLEKQNMSEVERAKKEAADFKARAEQLEQARKQDRITYELRVAGLREGVQDPADLSLANLEGVGFDEEGNLTGVDDAVKQLKERKPYLFKVQETPRQPGAMPPNPGPRASAEKANNQPTAQDLLDHRKKVNARLLYGAQ